MLTITVVVGLLPLVSITVDAAASYDDYKYVTAITYSDGNTYVFVSVDYPTVWADVKSSTTISDVYGIYVFDMDGGTAHAEPVLCLEYSDTLSSWLCSSTLSPSSGTKTLYRFGTSTAKSSSYQRVTLNSYTSAGQPTKVVTNYSGWNSAEKSYAQNYSTDVSQLPHGLDESTVQDIVSEQLNTQTATGTTAATIINNTTTQYNLYLSGDVSSEEMQSYVSSNLDTLSDLSTTTGNTLSDLMQINNAITYNQAIQDQLLNTASGNVQSMITGYTNTINTAVSNYQSGATSQADTVTIIQQQINNLNQLITNGTATTTADINAVNAAINAANGSLDSVTGYQDVDHEVSQKSQDSDQAELDYLDELTAETTATVEEIAPSQNFSASQASETMEVLDLVWENDFVKKLLPLCAGFMVICVVLGIKYKV